VATASVEAGEDCDDGSQNGSTNSCCTAACTFSGKVPDVIVGDLPNTSNYGSVGGINAYSVGTTSCNLGSCWLNWIANSAEKPVIGQNMYRLKDGRFEQIGQSWLKHGFTALQGSVCSNQCVSAPNGTHLGVNCSDPYDSSLNGGQSRLGPKADVNPNTGVYLYPDSRISTTGDAIFKRLQVHITDLTPALNVGAVYFVEGQYVTHDDATAKNNGNNASYRSVTVNATSTPLPYNLTLTGTTQRQKYAIQAWKATDASVTETLVSASDGQFIVSSKATSLGGGLYHYEYAVQNLNNHRAAQSFSVAIPSGTVVTNVGFHDVDYHSGEPFALTDWTPTVTSSSVSWSTDSFAVNPNANALRWGTLYNFRFDANVAPGFVLAGIELFKPASALRRRRAWSSHPIPVSPRPTGRPARTGTGARNPIRASPACARARIPWCARRPMRATRREHVLPQPGCARARTRQTARRARMGTPARRPIRASPAFCTRGRIRSRARPAISATSPARARPEPACARILQRRTEAPAVTPTRARGAIRARTVSARDRTRRLHGQRPVP
jgi:hypothetical protein